MRNLLHLLNVFGQSLDLLQQLPPASNTMVAAMAQYLDALIVGAGFGGIYQLKKLRDQGLKIKAIDATGGVGGPWYWNRYPSPTSS